MNRKTALGAAAGATLAVSALFLTLDQPADAAPSTEPVFAPEVAVVAADLEVTEATELEMPTAALLFDAEPDDVDEPDEIDQIDEIDDDDDLEDDGEHDDYEDEHGDDEDDDDDDLEDEGDDDEEEDEDEDDDD